VFSCRKDPILKIGRKLIYVSYTRLDIAHAVSKLVYACSKRKTHANNWQNILVFQVKPRKMTTIQERRRFSPEDIY